MTLFFFSFFFATKSKQIDNNDDNFVSLFKSAVSSCHVVSSQYVHLTFMSNEIAITLNHHLRHMQLYHHSRLDALFIEKICI
jgi:hypothetical protein